MKEKQIKTNVLGAGKALAFATSLFVLVAFFVSVSFATDISSCQTIGTTDNYTLTQNISSASTCFTFSANSIVLDCQGFAVRYAQSSSGHGVFTTNGAHTIKNCNFIRDSSISGSAAVYLQGSGSNQIFNNNMTGAAGVVLTSDSNDNALYNNIITNLGTSGSAIDISEGDRTILSNNTLFAENSYLSTAALSTNNNMTNTTFSSANNSVRYPQTIDIPASSSISSTNLNISQFNRIRLTSSAPSTLNTSAELTMRNLNLTNITLFVDFEDDGTFVACSSPQCNIVSYSGGILIFNVSRFTTYSTGSTVVSSCVSLSIADTVYQLTQNISASGDCLTFEANNMTLDCNGYVITGANTGTGISISGRTGSTVRNCTISNFTTGVSLSGGSSNVVDNNRIFTGSDTSSKAISISGSSSNNITRNIIVGGGVSGELSGIYLVSSPNTSIRRNQINNSRYGIYFTGGGTYSANVRDNTIYSNNVGIRSTTASITIDNNTVYSNTAIGVQVGASSLNITNNTLTLNLRGIYVESSLSNNSIYHNSIFNNSGNQAYGVSGGASAIELSYNNEGNWWGRSSYPFFVAGTDSNSADVVDSHPFSNQDLWRNISGRLSVKIPKTVNLANDSSSATVTLTGSQRNGTSPSNVSIIVGNQLTQQLSGNLTSATIDMRTQLRNYLATCKNDSSGDCTAIIAFSSATPGTINASNLRIDFERTQANASLQPNITSTFYDGNNASTLTFSNISRVQYAYVGIPKSAVIHNFTLFISPTPSTERYDVDVFADGVNEVNASDGTGSISIDFTSFQRSCLTNVTFDGFSNLTFVSPRNYTMHGIPQTADIRNASIVMRGEDSGGFPTDPILDVYVSSLLIGNVTHSGALSGDSTKNVRDVFRAAIGNCSTDFCQIRLALRNTTNGTFSLVNSSVQFEIVTKNQKYTNDSGVICALPIKLKSALISTNTDGIKGNVSTGIFTLSINQTNPLQRFGGQFTRIRRGSQQLFDYVNISSVVTGSPTRRTIGGIIRSLISSDIIDVFVQDKGRNLQRSSITYDTSSIIRAAAQTRFLSSLGGNLSINPTATTAGARIVLPPNSLTNDSDVNVQATPGSAATITLTTGSGSLLTRYVIEADFTNFTTGNAGTLEVNYTTLLSGGSIATADEANLDIALFENSTWTPLSATCNTTTKLCNVTLPHLSIFGFVTRGIVSTGGTGGGAGAGGTGGQVAKPLIQLSGPQLVCAKDSGSVVTVPNAFVDVTFLDSPYVGKAMASGIADSNGQFSFLADLSGNYRVTASRSDYDSNSISLTASDECVPPSQQVKTTVVCDRAGCNVQLSVQTSRMKNVQVSLSDLVTQITGSPVIRDKYGQAITFFEYSDSTIKIPFIADRFEIYIDSKSAMSQAIDPIAKKITYLLTNPGSTVSIGSLILPIPPIGGDVIKRIIYTPQDGQPIQISQYYLSDGHLVIDQTIELRTALSSNELVVEYGPAPLTCATNADCPSDSTCSAGTCTVVSCPCGYVQDRQCVSYSCCADTDCQSGQSCVNNQCVVKAVPGLSPEEKAAISSAIVSVDQDLNAAKAEGKDVRSAETVLTEARKAYEAGEFEKARDLIAQAGEILRITREPLVAGVPIRLAIITLALIFLAIAVILILRRLSEPRRKRNNNQ